VLFIAGKIKPTAMALSLIKGFEIAEGGGIELISQVISRHLNVSNENHIT
jgi:glycerol-3-phosphate dehydrogenase (NAD+)